MTKKYKIDNAGRQPDSADLIGCQIEEIEGGYELVAPRVVLATVSGQEPPLTFKIPNFAGVCDWTLTIMKKTHSEMNGNWTNGASSSPVEESDTWTATEHGSGAEGDEDAHAASATGRQ